MNAITAADRQKAKLAMLFSALCLLLTIQVYAALGRAVTSEDPPQPPDPVDDTWRN